MNDITINSGSSELEPFFELSPDLLCIAGYDGFFKRINPAVSRLLGYSNDELLSRPINEFVYVEDRDATANVRYELTRNKTLFNFENRYVTKSGEIVWLSWTSLPSEKDQRVFAVAKNVTHKKRMEEERNMLLANLTQINKDLKQLTYTTSHDLRTPVNNLISVFTLLDTSKINDPESVEIIEILKQTSENLRQTLNSYVDALTQKVNINEHIEEVLLTETFERVQNSIGSLIETSQATININFSQVEKIKFNKVYLESIFLNLLTNAIKYARPDRLPVISISSGRINGCNQLIFTDNGLGFDMDQVKDKVFGLHQKFHNHTDSKGIGLYLVYSHITSLGGQISLESKVNEGSTFTISFKPEF